MENKTQKNAEQLSPTEELYRRWNGLTDRIFAGMTIKERFIAALSFILTAAIATLASRATLPIPGWSETVSICHPLSDAFLCASGRYAPAAYLALMYEAYRSGNGFLLRGILLSGLILLRLVSCLWLSGDKIRLSALFKETLSMKIGSATVYSLVCCGIFVSGTPLTLETLPSALSLLIICPSLTILLGGFFDGYPTKLIGKQYSSYKAFYEISTYLIFAFCAYISNNFAFMGNSLSVIFASFITAVTAFRGGALRGIAVAVITGFVIDPEYIPALAIIGLFTGSLRSTGVKTAVGFACAAGCGISMFIQGYAAIMNWIPENLIAVAIAIPILRYEFLPPHFPFPTKDIQGSDSDIRKDIELEQRRSESKRLLGISEAFGELSIERKRHTDAENASAIPNMNAICQRLNADFCDRCPLVSICWENRREKTTEGVKASILQLYNHEKTVKIESEDFNCLRSDALKKELIRLCESPEFRSRTEPSPSINFSEEYQCVSEMIKHIASDEEDASEVDAIATEKAKRAAKALSFTPDSLSVFGKRIKTVVAYGIDPDSPADINKLRAEFSRACGAQLSAPHVIGGKNGKMVFESARVFDAENACAQMQTPSEDCNGDTATSFSTDAGYHYSLICDGMGNGKEAEASSCLAASLAEKLLRCEITPELTVRMIGNALRRSQNECFTTMDLLSADLMNGKASILKNGAASSYILREGDLQCLSAPSIPLGITPEATPERIRFNLRDGDTVIMVSDGIAQDSEDGEWLADLIKENSDRSPEQLAAAILSEASRRKETDPTRDDMTVSVTRIRRILPPISAAS